MTFKKIQFYLWIAFGFAITIFLIYKIARNSFTDYFLGKNSKTIHAVIIDERNYSGNQPVRAGFSYSYSFKIDEKKYTNNAHDPLLKIGDTIEIEYNQDYPSINKPLHPKE